MTFIPSFHEQVSDELKGAFIDSGAPQDVQTLVRPSDHADFQANGVMALAKKLAKNPRELGQEIISQYKPQSESVIAKCDLSGPGFINITVKDNKLMTRIQERFLDERLGIPLTENPRTIVFDYAQPNVAKEFHVGHLRSIVIGDCLNNILTFAGHKVIPRHHIGDWGTSFGMLIEYLIENNLDISNDEGIFAGLAPMEKLDLLYKKARQQFDSEEEFQDRSRKRVVAMQSGDVVTLDYWKSIVNVSIEYFYTIFDLLQITIDKKNICGESYYNHLLSETVQLLLDRKVAVHSQGAVCVFFDDIVGKDGEPTPLIVQKSDGGFGYGITDIAAIRDRVDNLQGDELLYTTDARQNLHMRMVYDAATRAGFVPANTILKHLPFGTVLGKDGKPFKTRSGESARLMDLIDAAIAKATEIVEEKSGKELSSNELSQRAMDIGIGAVKYADLSNSLGKDYIFDVDSMINLHGDTSVYIQYAYARIQSILRNNVDTNPQAHPTVSLKPIERELALMLDSCVDIFQGVLTSYEPHRLTHYLFRVASVFTSFYDQCSIMHAENLEIKENRLLLAAATAKVLSWGLGLLGIATPSQL